MTSAARAGRERRRLVRASEKRHRTYWQAVARAARIRALLAEMAAEIEMAAAADELAAAEDGAS